MCGCFSSSDARTSKEEFGESREVYGNLRTSLSGFIAVFPSFTRAAECGSVSPPFLVKSGRREFPSILPRSAVGPPVATERPALFYPRASPFLAVEVACAKAPQPCLLV